MAIISLRNLGFSYSDEIIFENVNASLEEHQRVVLLGINGSGKTTLLRLIAAHAGLISPDLRLKSDTGSIEIRKGTTIDWLDQMAFSDLSLSVWQICRETFLHITRTEDELHKVQHKLELEQDPEEIDRLLRKASKLQTKFEAWGGYNWEYTIERVLLGIGLDQTLWHRSLSTLSGGQKQKAALARILLSDNDLIILDEPTNHLDIEGREFLEKWLVEHKICCLLVSHDRYFIDKLATHIWEIDWGKLYTYKGNFTSFLKQRADRISLQSKIYQTQQEHIERTEDFIRKNIAGQNTNQAKGRRTLLARLERVEAVHEYRKVKIDSQPTLQTGDIVLEAQDLKFGYDSRVIIDKFSCIFRRGERIGMFGPNGSGKSTLLKLIARKLTPQSGRILWGPATRAGFLDQENQNLDPSHTLIDEIREENIKLTDGECRNLLAKFIFYGNDVFKRVEDLSGGERIRLSLCKLFYRRPNLLILDEPTNHLDALACEVLEETLIEFPGAILLVTHDRQMLTTCCNRLIAFAPSGIIVWNDNYQYFLEKRVLQNSELKSSRIISDPKNVDLPVWVVGDITQQWIGDKKMTKLKAQSKLESIFEKNSQIYQQNESEIIQLKKNLEQPEFYQDSLKTELCLNRINELELKNNELLKQLELIDIEMTALKAME